MKNNIFLSLGSNMGEKEQLLKEARHLIDMKAGHVIQSSSVYRTSAWGFEDQPEFYNQVLEIDSVLAPHDLLTVLQQIEHQLGRLRSVKWGPRTIDIDILFYKEITIKDERLTVPHPAIADRKFVLVPLAEIAFNLFHPTLKKTIDELLRASSDQLNVTKL